MHTHSRAQATASTDILSIGTNPTSNGSELKSLPLHPLQAEVPDTMLLRSAERAMVDVVNMVGVRINRVCSAPHTMAVVQFVSGLGPRKSLDVSRIVGRSQLLYRQQLHTLGPKSVYPNCAGFLQILVRSGVSAACCFVSSRLCLRRNVVLPSSAVRL